MNAPRITADGDIIETTTTEQAGLGARLTECSGTDTGGNENTCDVCLPLQGGSMCMTHPYFGVEVCKEWNAGMIPSVGTDLGPAYTPP